MELPEATRCMIKYTIQDHVHLALVRFIEQESQRIVASKQRVDIVKVIGVITVIRSGCKYWVEVEGRNSQLFQVIQFFNDPIQITTFESVAGGGRIPRFKWQVGRR